MLIYAIFAHFDIDKSLVLDSVFFKPFLPLLRKKDSFFFTHNKNSSLYYI